MSELLGHVARWPLLLGAVVCFGVAVLLAPASDDDKLAVAALCLAGVQLGAWLAMYAAGLAGRRPGPDES